MKILVADDSKTNLTLITASLKKLGHDVIPASSGREAIKIFENFRPDLIILDVVMEDINGFECAKRLRLIDSNDWIPIIFLSASVDDSSISKGIDAGGDDYLTKPYSEVTLAAKIKAMQRIADMRNALYETTQKLYLLSSTDALTGIANRFQFDQILKQTLAAADRYQHVMALLFLDLDNFKNVNDNYGHHIGDLLLMQVATRLKACLRDTDFIARLGGDEFAIILKEIGSAQEPNHVAEKIIQAVSRDYHLENHLVRHGVSIGIAIYPSDSTTKENIILNADVAMYHAKALGRNNYQCFSQELNEKYRQQMNLELSLKFAIERNQLYLTYQPIFELANKRFNGIEVSLGWKHPKYGVIPPNVFLPIAEESGFITQIGTWALQKLCEESISWPLSNFNNMKVAINISAAQLIHEEYLRQLKNMLVYTHFRNKKIELELTESTVMAHNSEFFIKTLEELRDTGIHVAIKDFGTGYSSLSRLKKLPINTLKIEKSFIEDLLIDENTAAIVNTIITLGKNLDLNIIAEGIISELQYRALRERGCPQGQGAYLCNPLNANQMQKYFEAYLETLSV